MEISSIVRFQHRLLRELDRLGGLDRGKGQPRFVVAPGRVNVLGEHTDYSGGFALPAAVDRGIVLAFAATGERRIRLRSLDEPGEVELDPVGGPAGDVAWGKYCGAVMEALARRGIGGSGWSGALASDIPRGAGMSSSAALCVALAKAFCAVEGTELEPLDLCRVAQEAEHAVGIHCGIMDQYAVVHGAEGRALLLDCRELHHRLVSVAFPEHVLVVGDTRKARGLVDSEYNTRRAQVEEAARILDAGTGTMRSLRDATPELVAQRSSELGPLLTRRALHVTQENARTLAAGELLAPDSGAAGGSGEAGDVSRRLGSLLDDSHRSLRDLFEVSCPELDALVEALREQGDERVPGARMMGGGFGGCVIALVTARDLDGALERAKSAYRARTGLEPAFFPVRAAQGARIVHDDVGV